jgi:ubiquinone/menaquinone biosynthesis C-methylase UbiE
LTTKLPPPRDIAKHYNSLLQDLEGEYIQQRWGDSEIKRRHYRQTELAIGRALERLESLGDVLEIGCGPAVWTPLFLAGAGSVALLDISEEMLKQARARIARLDAGKHAAKVRYTQGDFLEVDVAKRSYDTIISARAFEYMSDKQAFVDKCLSVLRPGGSLILVTKNRNWYDQKRSTSALERVPADQIPVERAMQLDLAGWRDALAMFARAGFSSTAVYPVIIGSYDLPLFSRRPGLAIADWLHRFAYRRRMNSVVRVLDPLTESFLAVGTRKD